MIWSHLYNSPINGKAKTLRAHRIAYALHYQKEPSNALDHLCRNRACCNPSHLEDVSSRVNTLRGIGHTAINARKTRCPRGHELSGHNLVIVNAPNRLPYRVCRTCRAANCARWRARCAAVRAANSNHLQAKDSK